MKALKTKVILSGIVLMIAFIATIGTTYAWFTVSTTASIDQLNLNVVAADNLLIMPVDSGVTYDEDGDGASTDLLTAGNYLTSVSTQDLLDAGYIISGPTETVWRLDPVTFINSTYDGFDGAALNSLDGTNGTISSATANANTGQYIQLQFYLLLQGEDGTTEPIELSTLSIGTSETGTEAEVVNAFRMSVWSTDDPLDTAVDNSATVFGNGLGDYDYTFAGTVYEGNLAADDLAGLEDAGYTPTDTDLPTDAENAVLTDTTTNLFTITANDPVLVTVNLWIEGWDSYADNDISLATFNLTFGFTVGS